MCPAQRLYRAAAFCYYANYRLITVKPLSIRLRCGLSTPCTKNPPNPTYTLETTSPDTWYCLAPKKAPSETLFRMCACMAMMSGSTGGQGRTYIDVSTHEYHKGCGTEKIATQCKFRAMPGALFGDVYFLSTPRARAVHRTLSCELWCKGVLPSCNGRTALFGVRFGNHDFFYKNIHAQDSVNTSHCYELCPPTMCRIGI